MCCSFLINLRKPVQAVHSRTVTPKQSILKPLLHMRLAQLIQELLPSSMPLLPAPIKASTAMLAVEFNALDTIVIALSSASDAIAAVPLLDEAEVLFASRVCVSYRGSNQPPLVAPEKSKSARTRIASRSEQ